MNARKESRNSIFNTLRSIADSESSDFDVRQSSIQNSSSDRLVTSFTYATSSSTTTGHTNSSSQREVGLPLHRAVFVVTNAALGTGLLNFPAAYRKSGGFRQALTVQACFIVLIIGSFQILGYCGKVHLTRNYQDTVRDFCGAAAQIVCQIVVVLYMFGNNVTHMIVIGDQLTMSLQVFNHPDSWYVDRKFVIAVISCVFILPLCLQKKLKVVSYLSFIGGLSSLYIPSLVVARYFTGGYGSTNDTQSSDSPDYRSLSGNHIFAAVPVICFGFQCHVTAVAVYAELKHSTWARFAVVTVLATAICAVIYSLTGTYGYLTFGDKVKSDILENYRANDVVALVGRVLMVFFVSSAFVISHFVGRMAIIGLWLRIRKVTVAEVESSKNRQRIIMSVIWLLLSIGIAIIVPTIGKAIAVVGALAAHFIFTFPGLCLIQVILQNGALTHLKKLGLAVGIMYVVIGMFLFGNALTAFIMGNIEGKALN